MERISILNGTFDPLTTEETIEAVFDLIRNGNRGVLSTVNVAILMIMRREPQLQGFVNKNFLNVADGQPLIWVSSWLGKKLPERVAGIDLVKLISKRAASEKVGVYLLGGTDEVIEKVAELLSQINPTLKIHFSNGYFSDLEAASRAVEIRNSHAKILFVGMGVPRQEKFIEQQWEKLGVNVAIGVGGSFDVLSGLRRRAPEWMQRIGLEWAFRLMQEPRRLFLRYLVTNIQFVTLVFAALIRKQFLNLLDLVSARKL